MKREGKISKLMFAALVWFAVNLFTSCPNADLPEITILNIDKGLAIQNRGSFTLQLAETTGRTILPVAPALNQFAVFELVFTATSAGDNHTVRFAYAGSAILPTVILVAGTYNITVSAYLGGDTTNPINLAARGIDNGVVIAPGSTVSRNITLSALFNEGQGTFAWGVNITATNVTSATMSIAGTSAGTSTFPGVNLLTTTSGNSALNAGTYDVTFRLIRTITTPGQPNRIEESVRIEKLYVYRSLTSTMPVLAFNNDSFHRGDYIVTFIHNDTHALNIAPIGTSYQAVLHGGVVGTTAPTNPGHLFNGWWTESIGGTQWNLTTGVIQDMTLYARWTPNQINITLLDVDNIPGALGVTFNPAPSALPPFITVSRSGNGFPTQVSITTVGTYDSLSWRIQGVGFYGPTQPTAQNVTGTSAPILLDANNIIYNSLGQHIVTVDIIVGGTLYRTNIRFNIVL
jgi:uncharacterized repeat protein (TIGR02543 family)